MISLGDILELDDIVKQTLQLASAQSPKYIAINNNHVIYSHIRDLRDRYIFRATYLSLPEKCLDMSYFDREYFLLPFFYEVKLIHFSPQKPSETDSSESPASCSRWRPFRLARCFSA
jgi:hypothetical protein